MCIHSDLNKTQQYATPAAGHRVFDVLKARLYSLYWDDSRRWTRGDNITTNDPQADPDFGFHAVKTFKQALVYAGSWLTADRVIAQVSGSGVVVRHKTGFRSTRMKILKLFVSDDMPKRAVAALKKHYRVPVVVGSW